MSQSLKWVPGNAPLDEGYWEALLRDGERDAVVPDVTANRPADMPPSASAPSAALEDDSRVDWWAEALVKLEKGEVLELPVTGCNRGGVLVEWGDLRGFVPASHLMSLSPFAGEDQRREELRRLVGSRLCLRVLEVDAGQERFVLSERAIQHNDELRQSVLDEILPGEAYRGTVTKLCSFGAFVDLGGLEGLVHVSELSWGRVDHPSDVLEVGQAAEVYVLNVDRERGRVGLSVKRLQPDPWQSVGDRYWSGQVVEGVVTNVVDFGAFVRVEDGLEGLVHVSQLAEEGVLHPRTVVQEGDRISVRVLNVDGHQRRMALSLFHD